MSVLSRIIKIKCATGNNTNELQQQEEKKTTDIQTLTYKEQQQ